MGGGWIKGKDLEDITGLPWLVELKHPVGEAVYKTCGDGEDNRDEKGNRRKQPP